MTNITLCPACGGTKFESYLSCEDYTVSHETFQIQKCTSCDFLLTNPRPELDKLDTYYASEDYISHTAKAASIIDRIYLIARNYTLTWKLQLINKHSASRNKLLDYGCGTGNFLSKCKENNWSTAGVEPSGDARAKIPQNIRGDVFQSIDEIDGHQFDAITLWHVLEHVPDLNETIQKLKSRLSQNGTIFIAVPNYQSWDATYYKEYWAAFDVPRHLWHFSQNTLSIILKNNGLAIKNKIPMKLDAYYISLLSEKYRTGRSGVLNMIRAILSGFKANWSARKTKQYSSIIYIVKNDF
jgi:2-polyprenyl-3-methyl-5-hydroxy-6-metoxy-1,4-benzoquinol methylase